MISRNIQINIAKAIGVIVVLIVLALAFFAAYELMNIKEIYTVSFVNKIHVVIPEDIYSKIGSNKLELRIFKQTELNTYTTTVNAGGQTYTQTNQTKTVTRNGDRRTDDTVLILDIPKIQEFDISISPDSLKEFKLFVYEKTN